MNAHELLLRITVVGPPAGVVFALQRGRSELQGGTARAGAEISFDFGVRIRRGADPEAFSLLGPFCQGTPARRFVYVNSGTYAGDAQSCWSRRAKVPLDGITPQLVARLEQSAGSILEGRIAGTNGDGGPACASVALLHPGWCVIARGP